ncbi:hypothetical protein [Streptomyces sp. HNM1019]|uniref:hypothetical protein n=1 Tax=Streptomyces sp. HNM1019 TaxID=3424717 RepID=UPI003D76F113
MRAPAYDPAVDIPDGLIELQKEADAERAKLIGLDGDEAAKEAGLSRSELEVVVKKAVRHPTGDGA